MGWGSWAKTKNVGCAVIKEWAGMHDEFHFMILTFLCHLQINFRFGLNSVLHVVKCNTSKSCIRNHYTQKLHVCVMYEV